MANDTSLAAERYLFERYARMEVHEKIEVVLGLNRLADEVALEGIRARHSEASDDECRLRLFAMKHGRDLALRAFGWDPEAEGW